MAFDASAAACIAEASRFYEADVAAVVAHLSERGGRPGEIRQLPDGSYEIGRARIPSREAEAMSALGITPEALLRDDCLNITIGTYLFQRDRRAAAITIQPRLPQPQLPGRLAKVLATPRERQCLSSAATRYHLPPLVLKAVLLTEGGWRGLRKRNTNGSYDLGPAQINTIHLPELRRYGVSETQLTYDVCVNLFVAAYRLRFEINRAGDFWRGVGNYHSRTPHLSHAYQERVKRNLALLTGDS